MSGLPSVSDDARKRFELMMAEVFDDEGRLRSKHKPPQKTKPKSLFTVDMRGYDGRFYRFIE